MNIDAFIEFLSNDENRSPETVKSYRSDLKLFAEFLEKNNLAVNQVDHRAISKYLAYLKIRPNPRFATAGLSRATIRRRIAAVKKYCDFHRSMVDSNMGDPTRGIRLGSPQNDDCKAVDDSVLSTLLNGIDSLRDKALFSLLITSGLRISELHQLNRNSIEVDQYTSETGEARILGTAEVVGKRSKKRRVYIDLETVSLLTEYLESRTDANEALFVSHREQRLGVRAIQLTLAGWCKRLGLEHIHPHALRHSFCTKLANSNMDSMTLKALMGHEDLRTTTRYYRLHDTTVARQYYSAIEFLKPYQY